MRELRHIVMRYFLISGPCVLLLRFLQVSRLGFLHLESATAIQIASMMGVAYMEVVIRVGLAGYHRADLCAHRLKQESTPAPFAPLPER